VDLEANRQLIKKNAGLSQMQIDQILIESVKQCAMHSMHIMQKMGMWSKAGVGMVPRGMWFLKKKGERKTRNNGR